MARKTYKPYYKLRKLTSYSGIEYKGLTIPNELIPEEAEYCSYEPIENGLIVRFSGLSLIDKQVVVGID